MAARIYFLLVYACLGGNMNQKRIFCIILLFIIASLDLSMVHSIQSSRGRFREKSQLRREAESFETLRAFMLPQEAYEEIISRKKQTEAEKQESLLAYLFCQSMDQDDLKQWCSREQEAEPQRYAQYMEIVEKLLADAVYFPVPEAINDDGAIVSYENSWQSERTYGGVRGHEGCDLMAGIQQRGYYPIISTSDGVVEKIGWLPKGGYRIGIRSPNGVYYYYAHLAEYEEGITEGTEVTAGQLLGYMGDTGYSEVEGTTGNFPVHLHFGIYLDYENGDEISYNPYYLLKILEQNKLRYIFKHK